MKYSKFQLTLSTDYFHLSPLHYHKIGQHFTVFIPAHRVVNHQGLLTGKHHFGNSTTMEQLLANEGIVVENDKVVDFREKFWDPSIEIDPFDLK